MKFQTVTFSRLVSGPGYTNTTIGATAILESSDSPESALAQLEAWVSDQFGRRQEQGIELRNVQHDLYQAQVQLQNVREDLDLAQRRWEAVKALAERLGVDLTARTAGLEEIPF